jgi:serine protease Do
MPSAGSPDLSCSARLRALTASSLLLAAALLASPGPAAAEQAAADEARMITIPSFTELAKRLMPVTVHISTSRTIKPPKGSMRRYHDPYGGQDDPFRDFFGDDFMRRFFEQMPQQEQKQRGLGSGFIIDAEGYILTNNHVVEGADEIKVTLHDEKQFDATVVGRDEKTDIALIKLKQPKGELPYAELGDSDALEIGSWVLAIGNPFGLQETVTQGIVSAKWRKIGQGPYDDFIQTDASINPGNSGGPLFNLSGKVVGINTAIFSPSGGNVGIGFAIPINIAKNIVPQLKSTGKVTRGWLGVVVQKVTPELAQSFGISEGRGALVADVDKEGPAAKAGIASGDIIITFNGREIKEMDELPMLVAQTDIGKTVDVKVLRGGKEKTLAVKIAELKESKARDRGQSEEPPQDFGIAVREITPEMARRYGLAKREGVIITEVEPGSQAEEAGLRPGDIIEELNRTPVRTLAEYNRQIGKLKKDENLLLLVRRGDNAIWVVLKPEK